MQAQLLEMISRQYGCATRAQILERVTRRQLDYLVTRRVLRRRWPGVYVAPWFAADWRTDAMAAVLSIGGAVLSHASAARLWGLPSIEDPRLHVTAPANTSPIRKGVVVHRSAQLPGHVERIGGIGVTTISRTLVDLSAHLAPTHLGFLLDQACNMKLVDYRSVDECLDVMITRGRWKIGAMRELLAVRCATESPLESFLERRVLRWIRAEGLPEPVKQLQVIAGGCRYRLDLAFEAEKVAVEAAGPHHLLLSTAARDRIRDVDLALEGWLVLHVHAGTDWSPFVRRLRTALAQRRLAM